MPPTVPKARLTREASRHHYLATFVTGLHGPFSELLRSQQPNAQVLRLDDGICVFRCVAAERDLARLSGARNVFRVLVSSSEGIRGLALQVAATGDRRWVADCFSRAGRGFHVVGWEEGQPISPKRLGAIERAVRAVSGRSARDTRGAQLSVMLRRGGGAFLLRKLDAAKPRAAAGELRSDLAELLCSVSCIDPDDVFLDPFCGSGAIALARARWPYRYIFCSDTSHDGISRLRSRFRRRSRQTWNRFNIRRDDALALARYEPGFVTRIVTDPPWGAFVEVPDLMRFYRDMLTEHSRIINRDTGVLVYLCGARSELEGALRQVPSLSCASRLDILVGGKKASVFRLRPV